MTTNIPTSKCKTGLLYGANGYTGELIARHALKLGLNPYWLDAVLKNYSRLQLN